MTETLSDSFMPLLRIIHIQKNLDGTPSDPKYDVIDASRYEDESGFADTSRSLSRQSVGDWLAREGLSFSAIERVLKELDQTGSAQVQAGPRIGPRIVRAWFDTVFNPIIPSLEFGLLLIAKRNWTFSFRTGTLERIRPIDRYLADWGQANLEQILQLDVVLAANIQSHDNAVERLQDTVVALHKALTANREFTRLCDSLLAETFRDLGIISAVAIFGAYPESDRYNLIAQDVVNNSGEQSSHYSTAKFWNRNREALLQSLDLPNVREQYASTIQIGEHLASVSRTLVSQFKEARQELSLRYDVPYMIGDSGSTAA
jgi:hypothetical protein